MPSYVLATGCLHLLVQHLDANLYKFQTSAPIITIHAICPRAPGSSKYSPFGCEHNIFRVAIYLFMLIWIYDITLFFNVICKWSSMATRQRQSDDARTLNTRLTHKTRCLVPHRVRFTWWPRHGDWHRMSVHYVDKVRRRMWVKLANSAVLLLQAFSTLLEQED